MNMRSTRPFAAAVLGPLTAFGAVPSARGAVIFHDDFSGAFPGPWTVANASSPVGERAAGWYHGPANTDLLAPGEGADATNFASSNFETAGAGPGAVSSSWLISPPLTLRNGDKLSLDVCATSDQTYPDRIQVRLNAHDAGTDTGGTAGSVGSFDRLLLDVNPTYATTPAAGGFPIEWTRVTVALGGLSGPTTGRFAVRYFVEDSGPDGTRGNEAGIDNVVLETPEPAFAGWAAAAAGLLRRHRRRGRPTREPLT